MATGGDMIFSLLVGYIGALEFQLVVRRLYHLTDEEYAPGSDEDVANLKRIQEKLRHELIKATELEGQAENGKAMQDGVLYKNGFRLDAQAAEIESLKERIRAAKERRRLELEMEFERQREIHFMTLKELREAESARMQRQREECRAAIEEAQRMRRLLEAEKERERENKRREEEEKALEKAAKQLREIEEERQKKESERIQEQEENEIQRLTKERQDEETRRLEEIENLQMLREKIEEDEKRGKENERKRDQAEKFRIEEKLLLEESENIQRLRKQINEEEEEEEERERERKRDIEEEKREIAVHLGEDKKYLFNEAESTRSQDEENQRAEEKAEKIQESKKKEEEFARQQIQIEDDKSEEVKHEYKEEEIKDEDENEEDMEKELEEDDFTEAELTEDEEGEQMKELEEGELEEVEEEAKLKEEEEEEESESEEEVAMEDELEDEEEDEAELELEDREVNVEDEELEVELKEEEDLNEEVIEDEDEEEIEMDEERQVEGNDSESEENESVVIRKQSERIGERENFPLEKSDNLHERLEEKIQREIEQKLEMQMEKLEQEEEEKQRKREAKQRSIEENAKKFLEAEQEMVELQQKLMEATHTQYIEPSTPVVEELIVKSVHRAPESATTKTEPLTQTVKTQIGQGNKESFILTSKTLLFPSLSDDASSNEPASSKESSFSTQPSEELPITFTNATTSSTEDTSKATIALQIPQQEREEPDGEDNNMPTIQYTDEYLRSLDGIKFRPLTREDGSGRRRAFKKRRSSGSSNSSRDSRTSREEELKMFTSLEEEEMHDVQKSGSDFTPIKYTQDSTLKVKPYHHHHHRRHKRSPAKDSSKSSEENLRGSLEILGEENTNPWGEVMPEHYKDSEFWKREKATSIDEEELELQVPTFDRAGIGKSFNDRMHAEDEAEDEVSGRVMNEPKSSTFETATHQQNEDAVNALQQKIPKQLTTRDESENIQRMPTAPSDERSNLIFSGEYTKAMDQDWHSSHFCCWHCDDSLTGQRYVIRDDHPYCIKCYENVFANTCDKCNKVIGIDSKDLSYKDRHWHEACFLCFKCNASLVDKQFGAKAERIYCGNCYDAQFASRCDGCGEVFRAGTKKMEYKTRQWHENCFCCCVCKMAIGTKSFIPREHEIYCAGCYEDKFATRCIKCNKVITSGGVTYKNEPWHRECFTCTHCNMTLAGQRFTSRDEKPYCAECFGELFAKRCTSCVKPITGIGGTRFISFEDRHWHHDCFVCASCKTSLVGRGFITDGPDIICPDCAKQKLS